MDGICPTCNSRQGFRKERGSDDTVICKCCGAHYSRSYIESYDGPRDQDIPPEKWRDWEDGTWSPDD